MTGHWKTSFHKLGSYSSEFVTLRKLHSWLTENQNHVSGLLTESNALSSMPFNWSDWVNGKKSEAAQYKYAFYISLEVKPSFEHLIPFFSII